MGLRDCRAARARPRPWLLQQLLRPIGPRLLGIRQHPPSAALRCERVGRPDRWDAADLALKWRDRIVGPQGKAHQWQRQPRRSERRGGPWRPTKAVRAIAVE